MATVHSSARLGRAVVLMTDGTHYLLDVENGETAVECPPTFLRLLHSMGADLSIQQTNEQAPFPHTYEALLRGWRRERTTSLILIALDGKMPSTLRSTVAQLANDLLAEDDCLTAARLRLSSSPLSEDADFDGVPISGSTLQAFLDFLRSQQPFIQRAADTWLRARVRAAEYSSWAIRLRETTGQLGGFLAMSSALASGRPEEFDSWLAETWRSYPQAVSSDLMQLMLAWKEEALSPLRSDNETEFKGQTIERPHRASEVVLATARNIATTADPIEAFLQAMGSGALSSDEILSTFVDLAPSWLQKTAASQSRPLADLIHDLIRSAPLNVAGPNELALKQRFFPDLREVWVFARKPLDLEDNFYSTVHYLINERFVTYYYFLPDRDFFDRLRERLIGDINNVEHVDKHLYFTLVPSIAFVASPGMGLHIPGDIQNIHGVTVTATSENDTIREAREMEPSQLRAAYIALRQMIETTYHRTLPRLPEEPAAVNREETSDRLVPETIQ